MKESGIGREGSHYGLDEFMEVKYMCMGDIDKYHPASPRPSPPLRRGEGERVETGANLLVFEVSQARQGSVTRPPDAT